MLGRYLQYKIRLKIMGKSREHALNISHITILCLIITNPFGI